MNNAQYKTIIFDCDGVVLDSNRIKTEAFRQATLQYGETAADALVMHHVANGGVSRYAKFIYFVDKILPVYAPGKQPGDDGPGLDALLATYATNVRTGLLTCAVAYGLIALREATAKSSWMIVSGGDQEELRDIFTARRLDTLFDGGIFGSPAVKHDIVNRELQAGNIIRPALFLGDSRLDHEVASAFELDFVFVSEWSEFSGWPEYCEYHHIPVIRSISELID